MADIASLGIETRTNGVDQAITKLKSLSGAAKQAQSSVTGMGSSTANAGRISASALAGMASQMKAVERTSQAAERALAAEALAAQKAASAAKVHAIAANQNVAGLVKTHNTANLAAQGFDIVTTAAGGMSAGLIGMQQGLQIAQVAMTTTGGFAKTLGAAFLAMLSPVTFLSIGLTTLAAVGIQSVNWMKLFASGLTTIADGLQAVAPYAVVAAGALALLYAPALIGGIVSLIALLGRLLASAVAAFAALAVANPFGALIIGITAAVAAANIFRDELTQIFGRDIVADAKNGVNFIIGAFVGGFNGIRAVWSQLPAAIGDAVYTTVNATISGVEMMLNKIIGMMNSFIGGIYSSIGDLASKVGIDVGSFGGIGEVSLPSVSNPYSGSAVGAVQGMAAEMSAAQNTDYVGGFASAITKGASVASAKLKELAKDLTTVDDKSKKKGGGGGKSEAEKYSDIVDGANRRIASLKAEQQALGMTEQAALALKYETDLLNQAQQKGITLTATQKAELAGLAQQMAATEIATKNAKEAIDFAKDATKGFLSDLRSGLANGESFWQSFGKAASNVLDKIVSKIEDELVNALFSLNGAGSGGGGGLFGSILGGIGKLFGFASGGYTGNGAANKAAGIVHGGEYVFSAKATKRIGVGNLESMHRAAKGYASGGSVTPIRTAANSNSGRSDDRNIHVTVGVSADNNGNLMPFVESVSEAKVTQAAPKIVSTANQQVMPTVARYNRDRAGADYRNG
ncbi:phage tail tape-measure protein [Agrobacterium tumefaciens]|uniref:phage tail tape-measure protein n=1 Tax=Agrobacterium tumefaciens TaxID=358 RepID=UPI001CC04301|nr:phage tail tape-measure protein [Agrobacterium tumefaciens]